MSDMRETPGCFGAASVFSHDSNICKACAVFAECADQSIKRLEEIRSIINVSDLLAKHQQARQKALANRPAPSEVVEQKKPEPKPKAPIERKTPVAKVVFEIDQTQQAVIARIDNKKAQQQAIVLCKSNMVEIARSELAEGRNPFDTTGPKFLQVACSLLLSGGFTKGSMKSALMESLGWSEGTASSHVAIICALLTAFGIAQATDEGFTLTPAEG